jgi:DNA replication protein DnaC
MEQLITDRLRDNLTRLNLNRASEILQTIAEQAETDKRSYLSFLDQLLEEEVAVKEKRRFQTAMKNAGLPTAKSIDEYDFSFHPQLNKKESMALFDMEFIAKHENVIFLGPPGVGKTHLAISLAIKAYSHGFKVFFTTMDTLIKKLKENQSNHKAYLTSPLVVVDEVGYLPIDSREAYLFFQFVSHRYERSSTFQFY